MRKTLTQAVQDARIDKPNPYADLNQPRPGESIYDFALRQPPTWEASTLHPDKVPITKARSEGWRRIPRRKTLAQLDGDE